MGRVVLLGLLSRPLRLILTLLAVALGVALISATYIFTDTIGTSFDRLFQETTKGTDAAITARQGLSTGDQGGTARTVPRSVLERVRADPQVAVAEGSVFEIGTVLGRDGKPLSGAAPSFIASVAQSPRFQSFELDAGRFPRVAGEALLDKATADRRGFRVGQTIGVQGQTGRVNLRITGIGSIAGVSSFGGSTVVAVTLAQALTLTGKDGFDAISAAAARGVTPQQLAGSLRARLPRSLVVRTGAQQAASQSKEINDSLGILKTALLAFAGIALFVGAFIIFNSFSITVQQRLRELGLLRALGAGRRQVLSIVLAEGLVLGLGGSLVGLGLGLALAPGLRALFASVGVDLPSNGLVLLPRTVIVALLIGTLVAVAASLVPAIRGTRVPPIAALRHAAIPTANTSRRVTVPGLLLVALGAVLIAFGLFGSGSTGARLVASGGGVVAGFLGAALLSPLLVRPLASLLGRVVELVAGFPGRLARENAMRQPGRTAVTASALMVGVALVTFASVFAAGAKSTIREAVGDNVRAQLVVVNANGFSPYPAAVLPAIDAVSGVERVSAITASRARVTGVRGDQDVSGLEPASLASLYRVRLDAGPPNAVALLASGTTVIVSRPYRERHGTQIGDVLTLRTPLRSGLRLRVVGVVDDRTRVFGDLTVANAVVRDDFGETKTVFGLVGVRDGADVATVQRDITRVLDSRFPEAEVQTQQEFIDERSGQVDQVLGLIYALLSLAVIVSLFGIVNTLVLSITERTAEIGMLRAIGTTQRQVRRIVRWEAVITALIGGITGAGLGILLSIVFTRPLDGFRLAIPVPTIIGLVLLSGAAGVLAAVLPARRAARLDVLKALAYE
ncbi:unannotated protein [freshwater metagenome]|uniref:Unannotated protein n=1 Tax=freshwater metagenome TaxID=449393 RepID=A0A6J7I6K8_9ZZZZ|nr:FtsX-like permease family protein [Actinomycetota bacterium]